MSYYIDLSCNYLAVAVSYITCWMYYIGLSCNYLDVAPPLNRVSSQLCNMLNFLFQVREYDSISRLDQWYTAILLRIKKNLTQEPDLT